MFTITRLRQISPTAMLATVRDKDGKTQDCTLKLDHSLRESAKADTLADFGGGVLRKLTHNPMPPTLIESLYVEKINSIDYDETSLVVDCLLSDGINTLLYPLGGLTAGDIVYRDNEGTVYTLNTAHERIDALSLLPGDIDLPPARR